MRRLSTFSAQFLGVYEVGAGDGGRVHVSKPSTLVSTLSLTEGVNSRPGETKGTILVLEALLAPYPSHARGALSGPAANVNTNNGGLRFNLGIPP